ncbi:SDR family NAD(P)-dependent oxidoreductase [Streptomyces hainanensis]|uniref:SDR family NAD(P)-dependent oxidoreductase n=1 Tax=Streptomyces hainanensis TaxID=402648 RepID=A0A4R4T9P4_9ACTN|nr:SDR family NAD(P)-dependent oxidoreductase [Streptomyces hainanensis]TDC73827.1 SDR family NAD(P)-dependent oxidoreductase [Streptomyces hainanensis]
MTDTGTHHGRIALVTGGNKGIGQQIVQQLAELGMTVYLGARQSDLGVKAAEELRGRGLDVRPLHLDVTDQGIVEAAAAYLAGQHGRLDVLVNNAGISGDITKQAPTAPDLDIVRAVYETNFFGPLRVTSATAALLRAAPAARVVNVTSSLGSLTAMSAPGSPLAALPPSAAYVTSKTALNSLTVQLAKDLRGDGVLVNAADPGACDTDFTRGTPFKAPRTAAQGAAVAVRLATLGPDGPTGGAFNEDGQLPW